MSKIIRYLYRRRQIISRILISCCFTASVIVFVTYQDESDRKMYYRTNDRVVDLESSVRTLKPMTGPANGPGENGEGVFLKGEQQRIADSLFEKEAFNIIASNIMAYNRSLPDVRDPRYIK